MFISGTETAQAAALWLKDGPEHQRITLNKLIKNEMRCYGRIESNQLHAAWLWRQRVLETILPASFRRALNIKTFVIWPFYFELFILRYISHWRNEHGISPKIYSPL